MKRLVSGLPNAKPIPGILATKETVNGRTPCYRRLSSKSRSQQQIRYMSTKGTRPRTAIFFPGRYMVSWASNSELTSRC